MFGTTEMLILVAVLLALVFAGVHIAVALGAAAMLGIYLMTGDVVVVADFLGSTAYEAAGKVHTDMQQGFARAEVIGWEELVAAGSFAAARDAGKLRIEGRDYVVADGDVITIRFSP